jgi:hypothetical protein
VLPRLKPGHRPSDWPAILVDSELSKRLRSFHDRADHAEILAWLLNRAPAPELTSYQCCSPASVRFPTGCQGLEHSV